MRSCTAIFLLLTCVASVASSGPRLDFYGDPLPPGAVARLGSVRWRIPREATPFACWFKDKKILVTGTLGNGLCEWDMATGKPVVSGANRGSPPNHDDDEKGMDVSLDGSTFVTAEENGTVAIYDGRSGQLRRRWPAHQGSIVCAALSRIGQCLATRSKDNTLAVWDAKAGKLLHRFHAKTAGYFTAVAISPDGNLVAWTGVSDDQSIHLFDVAIGKERWRRPAADTSFSCLAFSPDGRFLASAMRDNRISVCNVDGPRQFWESQAPWPANREVRGLTFSPDGRLLVALQRFGGFAVLDAATGKERWQDSDRGGGTGRLAFAPDSKTLAVLGGGDPTVYRYETASGRKLSPQDDQVGVVHRVWFGGDDNSLITLGGETFRAWRLDRRTPLATLSAGENSPIWHAVSPDREAVVVESAAGEIVLHELASAKPRWRLRPEVSPYIVAFSPNGRSVITVGHSKLRFVEWSDSEIALWDSVTRKHRWKTNLGQVGIESASYGSDGRTLLCAGTGQLFCFDAATGRRLSAHELPLYTGQILGTSPDGRTIACPPLEGRGLDLLEVSTLQTRMHIRRHAKDLKVAAFSSNGMMLATGNSDGSWQIWDAHSGRLLDERGGHGGDIESLAFSPDGRRLATGSDDTTVLVWDIRMPDKQASARVPSNADLKSLWDTLKSSNASDACRAIGGLVELPEQAVAVLRERLRPVLPPDPQRLARLIQDVRGRSFAAREGAAAEFVKIGRLAESFLQKAHSAESSPDTRQRIDAILKAIGAATLSSDDLQAVRAIEVLELIGNEEAKRLLKALTAGAESAPLTREARGALERLANRGR